MKAVPSVNRVESCAAPPIICYDGREESRPYARISCRDRPMCLSITLFQRLRDLHRLHNRKPGFEAVGHAIGMPDQHRAAHQINLLLSLPFCQTQGMGLVD